MKLHEIDKQRYRKHLNVVMLSMAAGLIVLAQIMAQLFIYLFSTPEAPHTIHIGAGVAAALIIVLLVVIKFRAHPYMTEVVYVWDLKQQLNKIQRKQRKIQAAVENDDKDAMIVLNFQYRGSKQLYELDDNTLTMEDLLPLITALEIRMKNAGVSISTDLYTADMLDKF